MKYKLLTLSFIPLLAIFSWPTRKAPESAGKTTEVIEAPFSVFSYYQGALESGNAQPVFSRLSQQAAIIYLLPEGSSVTNGQRLLEFDPSNIRRELNRSTKDYLLARSDVERLELAEFPLEIQELEEALYKAKHDLKQEEEFLEGSKELQRDGLVSAQEIQQEEARVDQLFRQAKALESRLLLIKNQLHPTKLEQARVRLKYAEEERDNMLEQYQQCRVYAEKNGTVIYTPLHLNNEFRVARLGDTVYRNQPFMLVADMSDLQVVCHVPEAQLSKARKESPASVSPLSFPEISLPGRVERVGAMAHRLAGRPAWQKYFDVTIKLLESHSALRSGMSVNVRVESYRRRQAIIIPRPSVMWEEKTSFCYVLEKGKSARRDIQVGMANETHYEVIQGLGVGEKVLLP